MSRFARTFGIAGIAIAGIALCAVTASAAPQATTAPRGASSLTWRVGYEFAGKPYWVLDALTMPGPSDAWAFGYDYGVHVNMPLALHWNGKTWAPSYPFPASEDAIVTASSGPDNVWAASSAQFISQWNGAKWKTFTYNASWPGAVTSIVTTGQRNAWAFTSYYQPTIAMHYNGRSWRNVTLGNFGDVMAAADVSASDIWLLTYRASGKGTTLLVHYNGKTWRKVSVPAPPLPKDESIVPVALAVAGARSVWATAQVLDQGMSPTNGPASLLLHWNGRGWRWIRFPGSDTALFPALAPDSADGAWAEGNTSSDNPAFYFLHWTGSRWDSQAAPTKGVPGLDKSASGLYTLVRVPRTKSSVWATAEVDNHASDVPVIDTYGRP
jgi:hypothetical protein